MTSVESLSFPEVLLIERKVHADERGQFSELYQQLRYDEMGIGFDFVQDNISISKKGVIRGMHCQSKPGQVKLVTCLLGEIFDVFVDIRPDSPTFGNWGSYVLNGKSGDQLLIPEGFAHGFACLSDEALVMYKTSSVYMPGREMRFCYDDPNVGIKWPIEDPILSKRDRHAPLLKEVINSESLDFGSWWGTR